jgi:tetraprenyl-beta-curcumene synthase
MKCDCAPRRMTSLGPSMLQSVTAVAALPTASAQGRALVAAAARELSWGLRATSRELRSWRRLALRIPDPRLRADALASLDRKRGHAHGAALFTILPTRRERGLLRLLVAYETLVDYLDNVSERHPDQADGLQLHQAMVDALVVDRPLADYYARHPWRADGGYLAALVETCRRECCVLPSLACVRPLLDEVTQRSLVLALNHEPDPRRRDDALRAWAAPEQRLEPELDWFELSGAASATLVVLVLLTVAADPDATLCVAEAAHTAYWPWVSLATTMLDSWADRRDDAAAGHHSYIAHYPDAATAVARVREAIVRGLQAVGQLPDAERHLVIVGCMVALYLSKPGVCRSDEHVAARELLRAGGPLVWALLPALRVWRIVYRQRFG